MKVLTISRIEVAVVIEEPANVDISIAVNFHIITTVLKARTPCANPAGPCLDRFAGDSRGMGEIRGDEALDMLQAIATGHDGCLAVMHASSPRDAISRLEMMALSRGLMLPLWAIHRQISQAIDLIVQHELFLDGVRRITHITQVGEVQDDQIELRDIFEYSRHGRDPSGRQCGQWMCHGVEDDFLPKFEKIGMAVPADVFNVGPEPA